MSFSYHKGVLNFYHIFFRIIEKLIKFFKLSLLVELNYSCIFKYFKNEAMLEVHMCAFELLVGHLAHKCCSPVI